MKRYLSLLVLLIIIEASPIVNGAPPQREVTSNEIDAFLDNPGKEIEENLETYLVFIGGRFFLTNAEISARDLERLVQRTNGLEVKLWVYSCTINGDLDLSDAKFSKELIFQQTCFDGETNFSMSTFSEKIVFRNAQFSKKANFKNASFPKGVDFKGTTFDETADFDQCVFGTISDFRGTTFQMSAGFDGAEFSGKVDFCLAKFVKEATFAYAHFSKGTESQKNSLVEADFRGAQFDADTDFSHTTFQRANFDAYAEPTLLKYMGLTCKNALDTERIPDELSDALKKNMTPLSASATVTVEERGAKWSISDKDTHQHHIVQMEKELLFRLPGKFQDDLNATNFSGLEKEFRERDIFSFSSPNAEISTTQQDRSWQVKNRETGQICVCYKDDNDESHLKIYSYHLRISTLKETTVHSLNLMGSRYKEIYIDPQRIKHYNFNDEPVFYRLMKNQKDLGRPHEHVYLKLKQFQQDREWWAVKWMKRILYNYTTKYGTASVPWGLTIYGAVLILIFTLLYSTLSCRKDDLWVYIKPDDSVTFDKKPNFWEIFWFSVHAFLPAIELINACHWKPRERVKVCRWLRFSTIVTIESILGWLMIPALLSYIKLQ